MKNNEEGEMAKGGTGAGECVLTTDDLHILLFICSTAFSNP